MKNLTEEMESFSIEFSYAIDLCRTICDALENCMNNGGDYGHLFYPASLLHEKMQDLFEENDKINLLAYRIAMNIKD